MWDQLDFAEDHSSPRAPGLRVLKRRGTMTPKDGSDSPKAEHPMVVAPLPLCFRNSFVESASMKRKY